MGLFSWWRKEERVEPSAETLEKLAALETLVKELPIEALVERVSKIERLATDAVITLSEGVAQIRGIFVDVLAERVTAVERTLKVIDIALKKAATPPALDFTCPDCKRQYNTVECALPYGWSSATVICSDCPCQFDIFNEGSSIRVKHR